MIYKEEIHIGSTGFSQFGTPDYYEKAKFEGNWLKKYFAENFKLHKRLTLSWKRQPYEHDCYWDLLVWFYDEEIEEIEEIEETEMWQCINDLEAFDIESLEEQIEQAWKEDNFVIIPLKKTA